MREQIKKQLLDSLEEKTDNSLKDLKFKSSELALNFENSIFENTGKNSKEKSYREKTKKIIGRIKGARNNNIRIMLKSGIILIEELCKMTDKQIDDDLYFTKLANENNLGKASVDNNKGRLPKINIPLNSLDFINNNGNKLYLIYNFF
jgi:hypothetical protein